MGELGSKESQMDATSPFFVGGAAKLSLYEKTRTVCPIGTVKRAWH